MEYRYILEKGSKKIECPECGKRRFVPYVDTETGEILPDDYGRCDREVNCGYFLNPYTSGYALEVTKKEKGDDYSFSNIKQWRSAPKVIKEMSIMSPIILQQSRANYNENNFVKWLIGLVGTDAAAGAIARYHIGTSKHWSGSTVFWQIDTSGTVRSGKIMLYDATTGKRVKKPYNHISWAHKALKYEDYELQQCYFGEHLLRNCNTKIGLVESEKTAIIASIFMPQFTWLAVGSLTNLNKDKSRILAGCEVVLFPDLGGYDKWAAKASEMNATIIGATFTASDILEKVATQDERQAGYDLADYLIRHEPSQVANPEPSGALENIADTYAPIQEDEAIGIAESVGAIRDLQDITKDTTVSVPKSWSKEIEGIELFFNQYGDINGAVQLDKCAKIENLSLFVDSHLMRARQYDTRRAGRPYLDRLTRVRNILENKAA